MNVHVLAFISFLYEKFLMKISDFLRERNLNEKNECFQHQKRSIILESNFKIFFAAIFSRVDDLFPGKRFEFFLFFTVAGLAMFRNSVENRNS